MATDFRNGELPGRGGEVFDGYMWIARVFDKARAARNGTIHDYIYPCPMDRGVFERWGITPEAFHQALETCSTDEQILAWVKAHVGDAAREKANTYLLTERLANLDKQDLEE